MRDVSKILSDAEVLALKQLLSQQNLGPIEPGAFKEYPKVLYVEEFVTLSRLIKEHPDPLVKKEAKQKLSRTYVVVTDFEEEQEYLEDGWKTDPNEFIIEMNIKAGMSEAKADPRRPGGREGRMAAKSLKAQREAELRHLKRRFIELTGQRIEGADLSDDPSEDLGASLAADDVVPPPYEGASDDGRVWDPSKGEFIDPPTPRTKAPKAKRTLPAAVTQAAQKAARPRSARA